MNTILTVCTKCSMPQLADGKLTGKRVRCASCDCVFVCRKKVGPIKWVREITETFGVAGFEKAVTKVIFNYGVAVPAANQEAFISHIGSAIEFGARRDVKIRIDDIPFDAKISYFKNKRGEPSLHFLWKSGDAIGLKLRERLSRAYKHYIINKSDDFLGGESVVVAPGSHVGEYVLSIKTSSGTGIALGDPVKPPRKGKAATLEDDEVKVLLSELKI